MKLMDIMIFIIVFMMVHHLLKSYSLLKIRDYELLIYLNESLKRINKLNEQIITQKTYILFLSDLASISSEYICKFDDKEFNNKYNTILKRYKIENKDKL